MKYKVNFSGFAYVEADDEEEAKNIFLDKSDMVFSYRKTKITTVEEVDDFVVEKSIEQMLQTLAASLPKIEDDAI